MVQRRGGSGFAQEALPAFVAGEAIPGQGFQRHHPSQARILSPVHKAHPAAPQEFDQPVMSYRSATHLMRFSRLVFSRLCHRRS
jgi:hypothetical protein